MNNWAYDNYAMQQAMMGQMQMPGQNVMMPPNLNNMNMMQAMPPQPQPPLPPGFNESKTPLLPPPVPPFIEMGQMVEQNNQPMIGPIQPDNNKPEEMNIEDDTKKPTKDKDRHSRDAKKDKERDNRDGNQRSSRDRNDRRGDRRYDNNDRSDRNDRHRDRSDNRDRRGDRRDRRSKWDDGKSQEGTGSGIMMPGMTPQYSNMMNNTQNMMNMQNMLGMQNMPGMQNMSNMMPGMNMDQSQNMSGMQNMPGMNMDQSNMSGMQNMPGMNMDQSNMSGMQNMPGMNMDQSNMSGMQNMPGMQNMMSGMNMNMMGNMMSNQSIYLSNAVLLPPLPGTSMPARREKPPGCRTIFVGGLPKDITEKEIEDIFQQFGSISTIKLHNQGVCHVRFENGESVEQSFFVTGFRYKMHSQNEKEATTIFVDYAMNYEDKAEFEKSGRSRQKQLPRTEPYSPNAVNAIAEKLRSEEDFQTAAPTLLAWLEKGECNKQNATTFYSMVQASNNQTRRLFNEKMAVDDQLQQMKAALRDKYAAIVEQFEQVARILSAAKHQRVSDHFTKVQRRNIEMWYKMTEELENIKEEFNANFSEDDIERGNRNVVAMEKFQELQADNERLLYELEGYKNEAYLAKDEAERRFETFKAHFIAQQALQHKQQAYSSSSQPNLMVVPPLPPSKPAPPIPPSEAKVISFLTLFLMIHPTGASLNQAVSYVKSLLPSVAEDTVKQTLKKYSDIFACKMTMSGENQWLLVAFEATKDVIRL